MKYDHDDTGFKSVSRYRKKKFNPDRNFVSSAVNEYLKNGGEIKTITQADVRNAEVKVIGFQSEIDHSWSGPPLKEFLPKKTNYQID